MDVGGSMGGINVPPRRIMHVDINSYFATILQQENPALRNKPIGVVKGRGRTCLIAASKEAKRFGVKTGESLIDARVKCPNIIPIQAHFGMYLSCTHKLNAVFQQLAPQPDIFSLDEAFLDLTGCELFAPDLLEYGKKVQKLIQKTLGEWVTCNVGIAHNKLLAKMSSEVSPKGSVTQVTSENMDDILASTPFESVCGIGYGLSRKLLRLGVTTPLMINLIDDETLLQYFGPFWSKELRLIGRGEETHFFTRERKVQHMQSVGRTITGYRLEDDEMVIRRVLLNLLEEATYKIRTMKLSGRKIGIQLWGHGHFWSAHRTLQEYVRHSSEIFPVIYNELYKNWKREFKIIKFGVWVSDLKPVEKVQQSLFLESTKREKISEALDAVNNRFGGFTLMPATLLGDTLIRPEVTGFLGDRIYHGL